MVACAKVIVFFGLFCCFFLAAQKHYKNRVFDDFEMLIFSFLGQNFRVNNLATVGSITWPHFLQKNAKNVAKLSVAILAQGVRAVKDPPSPSPLTRPPPACRGPRSGWGGVEPLTIAVREIKGLMCVK